MAKKRGNDLLGFLRKEIKEEVPKLWAISWRNLIIVTLSAVILIGITPTLAQYFYLDLWSYSYDNIDISVTNLEFLSVQITKEGGLGVVFEFVIEALVVAIVQAVIAIFASQLVFVYFFIARTVRFVYLIILTQMILLTGIIFLISIIYQRKAGLKFSEVFISVFIASIASLGITYFYLIPDNNALFQLFIDFTIDAAQLEIDFEHDILYFILDVFNKFYTFGILALILVNFFIATGLEFLFSRGRKVKPWEVI